MFGLCMRSLWLERKVKKLIQVVDWALEQFARQIEIYMRRVQAQFECGRLR